jgi:uncharacterized membrane protein YccF (DUF307 family)
MELLGNVLWIVLGGGLAIFLEYVAAGIALCCTIIGIPFGIQCFKLAIVGLVPFGIEIREKPHNDAAISLIMNVIWLLIGGIGIALTHVLLAVICGITIIGLPFAWQHLKMTRLALFPFGKVID